MKYQNKKVFTEDVTVVFINSGMLQFRIITNYPIYKEIR